MIFPSYHGDLLRVADELSRTKGTAQIGETMEMLVRYCDDLLAKIEDLQRRMKKAEAASPSAQ